MRNARAQLANSALAIAVVFGANACTGTGGADESVQVLDAVEAQPTAESASPTDDDAGSTSVESGSVDASDSANSTATPDEAGAPPTTEANDPSAPTDETKDATTEPGTANGPDPTSDPETGDSAEAAEPGAESLTFSGVKRTRARLNAPGNLTVKHTEGSGEAKVVVHQREDRVIVKIDENDAMLNIDTTCREKNDPKCRAHITVFVAPGTGLNLATAVGEITVDQPSGPLQARTDVGAITLTRPTGRVDAETGVGDITVRNARAGRYRMVADVGAVFMSARTEVASLDASTGTGNIEIVLPQSDAKYQIAARTGLGNRSVDVSTEQGGAPIRAEAGVGDVTVRYG